MDERVNKAEEIMNNMKAANHVKIVKKFVIDNKKFVLEIYLNYLFYLFKELIFIIKLKILLKFNLMKI